MTFRRWWRDLWPAEKSVTAWREIARTPDDPALFHEDGRSRRARVSRFPEPDREALRIRAIRRVK
jgi:hypothetical protein